MSINRTVSLAVTPWRIETRENLLDRFLATDFYSGDAVTWLRGLIGRGALGSREHGRWAGNAAKPDAALVRDYAKLQLHSSRR